MYKLKTLLRNHRLYELKVYRGDKLLMRFRDSCTMLPSPLNTLAKTLCPELGSKGSLPHDILNKSNIMIYSDQLIPYLKQDILLLGGVMLKAQDLYRSQYHIDIEEVMTISSLSLKIFRMNYLDDDIFPIHIPTQNQDSFIRRGYYGGHSDVYKPYGENLHYYDVNSLYPFIMKSYPMPCGIPVWHNKLESVGLDSLFGFIEAYVVCPTTISKPFLPYKEKNGTLLFPTGKFIGVYYSEELKFARDLGYDIIPLRGYLFEKKSSPFEGFISHLYESRQEAKKAGDEAMTFIYKLLMNSLYGRFGMNPESTVTEICNQDKYEELMKKDNFQSAEKLTDHYYIVNYTVNSTIVDDTEWKAPKMSAVQLSAAITACARIYMYPFISRPDCYYTDTDSIVLGSPLSDNLISSLELGKFKLECNVRKGIFLAPKSYMLEIEEDRHIIKHKGPAKELVTSDWFQRLLDNLSLTEQIPTSANFRIDWKELRIVKKDLLLKLGLPRSTKRDNVYDSNNVWIDTKPIEVIDIGSQDATTILKYELLRMNDESVSQETNDESVSQSTTLQPTLYNTKAEAKKARMAKAKIELKAKRKMHSNKEISLKEMLGLPKKWDVETMATKDSKDLNKVELHDLFADLKANEFDMQTMEGEQIDPSVTTTLSTLKLEPTTSFENSVEQLSNDTMSLFVRKFEKLMINNQGSFQKNSHMNKSEKEPNACFNCEKTCHFTADCPKPKKDNKRSVEKGKKPFEHRRRFKDENESSRRKHEFLLAEENKSK
ncbi:DNA polymerase-like [Primulina tabacum]|uniref:DNA polymerase-like n=1 Tax=Primulina tabacum TaxID=48773 RepID=UPI003F598C2B